MKSLPEIFDDENAALYGAGRTRILSAADGGPGGSNDHDNDQSEKLKLLRKMVKTGRQPRKADGSLWSDHEMLAQLTLEKMQELYDATQPAKDEQPGTRTGNPVPANPQKIINLSAIFDLENTLRLLVDRRETQGACHDDEQRIKILSVFVNSGKVPKAEDGTHCLAPAELLEIPMHTLRLLCAQK
ncbi:MAG: hypothetical protein ACREE6_09195 [Limisphaerales bacterium]